MTGIPEFVIPVEMQPTIEVHSCTICRRIP